VLAVLTASTASAGTISSPIVGGSMVPPGKWPDAVAILGPDGSCTGTLIAPDVVLTAGHCTNINATEIVANTTNYNGTGGQRVAIESITAYPNYREKFDVAVIVLVSPVTGVVPRSVGGHCTFSGFAEDTMVHLVGFGLTDTSGTGANTALREAMAPVLDASCSGGNGCRDAVAPQGEFVAGGAGGDSCFGDSGGPVYLDTSRGPVLVAAVSRGLEDSATPCGGGGIYVRTDKVLAWIEQTTGREIAKDCPDEATDVAADDTSVGCSSNRGGASAALILLAIGSLGLTRRRRVR
jgi:endonuclease G